MEEEFDCTQDTGEFRQLKELNQIDNMLMNLMNQLKDDFALDLSFPLHFSLKIVTGNKPNR
jgi:hypothetical protein